MKAQKKKVCNFSVADLYFLVRLAGIEPTTPWFVAKYSIQLSYSRRCMYSSTKKMVGRHRLELWTKGL